ncbi:hypothetical protein [Microbulbifer sp. TRSA007]|uniref:hypothetical protein n=1 Tax=Microbulbifer sp. TRSA007 TaxID=3243384 RepID=UPI004039B1B3
MFDSIRKKINQKNEDNSPQNVSLDFKLMFVYHIAMMVLFATRVVDDSSAQASFALVLGLVLVLISTIHKFRAQWKWPGLGIFGVPSALMGVIFVYAFLAFAAYSINPEAEVPSLHEVNYFDLISESWVIIKQVASLPALTPWFLAGAGIGVFNLLSSLKLVATKKSEFEAQCTNS